MSDIPHGKISRSVADVIKAALPKSFHKTARLQIRGQILLVVGREPTIEQPEMIGHRPDVPFVACRSKINSISIGTLLPDQ